MNTKLWGAAAAFVLLTSSLAAVAQSAEPTCIRHPDRLINAAFCQGVTDTFISLTDRENASTEDFNMAWLELASRPYDEACDMVVNVNGATRAESAEGRYAAGSLAVSVPLLANDRAGLEALIPTLNHCASVGRAVAEFKNAQ